MRSGKTLAFVAIALLAGGIVSQLPSALGDDSDNPLGALWDAIFDLQNRDEDLQAQIDELRVEGDALVLAGSELASDPYAVIEVEVTEDGRTLVHITAGNSGTDRAAGVKVTAFYLMPLFEINSLDDRCEDKGRGIIECVIGTLEPDQESVITIDATARESGEENTWTVDISTTTDDADYTNNHETYDFETGSADQIEVPEVEQPAEEEDGGTAEEPEAGPEPEQDGSTSNSTETETEELPGGNQTSAETEETVDDSSSNGTGTEEPQGIGNQTSTENESEETSGNQTSTEETPSGNQTSAETEETVDDSSSTGTSTETEDSSGESSEESSSEESNDGNTQEEQEQSDDSGAGESSEDGSEESGSEEESSEGGTESGDGGESPSQ